MIIYTIIQNDNLQSHFQWSNIIFTTIDYIKPDHSETMFGNNQNDLFLIIFYKMY